MKILGIIGEYNPMHSGHIYHLKKSLEITKADYSILIMSGNFTQTGNISILNKYKRAELAVENGFDLVIELPTIYATASANYFAYNAINLLNNLNCIDYLSFGSEQEKIYDLQQITTFICTNETKINTEIKMELKTGISYPLARKNVLARYLSNNLIDILAKPNNILAIEYICSLKKLKSNIQPIIIHRDNNFNETKLITEHSFTSATSIRNYINNNENINSLKKFLPTNTFNTLNNDRLCFNEDMYKLIKYKILELDINQLREIEEITEGLEYKIIHAINSSHSYQELINNIKSKRYTNTKIKRILVNILLNKTKLIFKNLNDNNVSYAHILKVNKNSQELLSLISKNSNIDLITSQAKYEKNMQNDKLIKDSLKLDTLASNIHSLITNDKLNLDYTNKIIY